MAKVVLVVDDEAQREKTMAAKSFFAAVKLAIKAKASVAVDCEGVGLSRIGTLEIVSLHFRDIGANTDGAATSKATYLVDLGGTSDSDLCQKRLDALKELFENDKVVKVIHDCKMDCDALYHHFGIRLDNVHDTSSFHFVISGEETARLNDVLAYNGIPTNRARDTTVYDSNPTFWATRPMTPLMKSWASRDVDKLLVLASKQDKKLLSISRSIEHGSPMYMAVTLSVLNTKIMDMKLERGIQCKIPMGRFIGKKGSNRKRVSKETGTHIVFRPAEGWLVYYKDDHALAQVLQEMGY